MATYLQVHPDNPQPRALQRAVAALQDGELVAYPTDSCYALGVAFGNVAGMQRIKTIRQLSDKHHFTLVVDNFAKLGAFVEMDNWVFRAVKAATPGPYTFILPATREVPRAMQHPKKRSVGVRVPAHTTTRALLAQLDAPLLSSTLLLPGHEDPPNEGWQVDELVGHEVGVVLDSGDCGSEPTTVVNLTGDEPVIERIGAGDPTPFQINSK